MCSSEICSRVLTHVWGFKSYLLITDFYNNKILLWLGNLILILCYFWRLALWLLCGQFSN